MTRMTDQELNDLMADPRNRMTGSPLLARLLGEYREMRDMEEITEKDAQSGGGAKISPDVMDLVGDIHAVLHRHFPNYNTPFA